MAYLYAAVVDHPLLSAWQVVDYRQRCLSTDTAVTIVPGLWTVERQEACVFLFLLQYVCTRSQIVTDASAQCLRRTIKSPT